MCTEKPDTVRYADTVRYKTYSPVGLSARWLGDLNSLAREVFHTYKEGQEKTLLASRFKDIP